MNFMIEEKDFKILLGRQLKRVREGLKLSRNKVSQYMGVSQSTIQAWEESGERTPNSWDLYKLSMLYEKSINFFYQEFSALERAEDESREYLIPFYEKLDDLDLQEVPKGHLKIDKDWLKANFTTAKELVEVKVDCHSLVGVVNRGDHILVDLKEATLRSGIYLFKVNHNVIIRYVQRLPNNRALLSSNDDQEISYELDLDHFPNDYKVLGKVIMIIKMENS